MHTPYDHPAFELQALHRLKQAAEAQNISAMAELGYRLFTGSRGAEQALQRAEALLRLASPNSTEAALHLANLLFKLHPIESSGSEIVLNLLRAASAGHAQAKLNLACLAERGWYVPQNAVLAARLYEEVIDTTDALAPLALFQYRLLALRLPELNLPVNKDMPLPEPLALTLEALQQPAGHPDRLDLLRQATRFHFGPALLLLGRVLQWQDREAAYRAFRLAAAQGIDEALLAVGKCYDEGLGTRRDSQAAYLAFSQVAGRNHFEAVKWMANFYYNSPMKAEQERWVTHYRQMRDSGQKNTLAPLPPAPWLYDGRFALPTAPADEPVLASYPGNPSRPNGDWIEAFAWADTRLLTLADGVSGQSGAATTATETIRILQQWVQDMRVLTPDSLARAIEQVDHTLPAGEGETTLVVAAMQKDRIIGASVGDSSAFWIDEHTIIELTEKQVRRPLIGSGKARATAFELKTRTAGTLLLASDGLTNEIKPEKLRSIVSLPSPEQATTLLLEDIIGHLGELSDDTSMVLLTRH